MCKIVGHVQFVNEADYTAIEHPRRLQKNKSLVADCGEANGLRLCDIHNQDKILPTEGSSCILQKKKGSSQSDYSK